MTRGQAETAIRSFFSLTKPDAQRSRRLADHSTTVVGRGVSLWIAVQSLSQLDAVYGKVRAQVLRDNMESQIYYRPSNQETAEYLERCLGRTSEYAHSQTVRDGTKTSQGFRNRGCPYLRRGK